MLQDQSRNRTPMPGAQAPAATPPDTGPARAEAGIAAMLSNSPFVLPAQMPAAGSPEAMALHKAACTEFDRRTHLTEAEYARLKIGDTHTLWTLDTVQKVIEGDYSSLLGNEAYAASAATPAELQELLVLTTRREQQFAEALRDLKLHEVHALAFPDEQEEAGAEEGEDPIFAAIRAHKAAYAAWLPHLRATTEAQMGTPSYDALEAAAEPSRLRECETYEALSEVLPTTLDGLVALAGYLPGAVLRNSVTDADSDAMHALGAMCGAVKELVKSGRIKTTDKDVDWHSPPPGFMASPAIEPTGFTHIEGGLRIEANRLLGIALAEMRRRREGRPEWIGEAEWQAEGKRLRKALHLDALASIATPEHIEITGWRYEPESTEVVGEHPIAAAGLEPGAPSRSTTSEVDPILTAIEASRTAQAAMQRWSAGFKTRPMSKADFAEEDRLNKVQIFAHDTVIATVPTTAAGRLALLDYLRWQMGLFGMADGNPPEAGSAFWPDALKALKAALAFDGTGHDPVIQSAEAKFPACSVRNLARLYDTFSAHWRVFSQGMGAPFCWDGDNYGTAGQILDAECDRLARIMDNIVREMQARPIASKSERDERLGVLMRHEFECNGRIHDTGLLADVNTAWGA